MVLNPRNQLWSQLLTVAMDLGVADEGILVKLFYGALHESLIFQHLPSHLLYQKCYRPSHSWRKRQIIPEWGRRKSGCADCCPGVELLFSGQECDSGWKLWVMLSLFGDWQSVAGCPREPGCPWGSLQQQAEARAPPLCCCCPPPPPAPNTHS